MTKHYINTIKMIRTELPEYDNCITYYKCDVSKQDEMKSLISYTESVYHKVNIIFNNASIMMNTDKSLIETDDNTFDRTYEVNVKGTFYGCKFGIQALRRAGGGVIINVSSFVSIIGSAVPQIAYTASQGAILSMTKDERLDPKIINGSRKKRISGGSGADPATINKLLKQFKMMTI